MAPGEALRAVERALAQMAPHAIEHAKRLSTLTVTDAFDGEHATLMVNGPTSQRVSIQLVAEPLTAVTVYRLVTVGTVEEQILSLHAEKRALVEGVLEGTGAAGALSTQELLELVRTGAVGP